MAELKKIVKYLDKYLEIEEIEDKSWNGLQVEGKKEVNKVVSSVTAGVDVFEKAKKENPDLILVHHGIFWKNSNPSIRDWYKERVLSLLKKDISLYVSHLPLDRHPVVGNNAQILKVLKVEVKEEMSERKGKNIGWIGECEEKPLKEIVDKINEEISTKSTVLDYGKKKVKRIGVVSGGAPYDIFEAIDKEVDLFITGDAADITEVAKDAKINVIFAGHYATETLGVKALNSLLKNKFNIETSFVDVPTNL